MIPEVDKGVDDAEVEVGASVGTAFLLNHESIYEVEVVVTVDVVEVVEVVAVDVEVETEVELVGFLGVVPNK